MFFKKNKPVVRERNKHCISRSNIDPDAVKVLYRLANNNFIAYLVGGAVRDLLLKRQPKDFDISTDAQPRQIRRLFRNCFLIGRRFRLAHIVFGRKVIETSTFRATPKPVKGKKELYQSEDNTFGSPAEDALRRDFTVNGLFYDIKSFAVIDYVGGLKDLEKRIIRSIGNPNVRFREDPVRMMRAVRFAAKLDFTLGKSCRRAVQIHHSDILHASTPRISEEIYRLFTVNASEKAFRLMWELKLLEDLLPSVSAYIDRSGGENSPLWKYMAALDAREDNGDLSNGVRTAVLYYALFLEELDRVSRESSGEKINRMHAARNVLRPLASTLNIPKAVFYSAVAAMDMLPRFDKMPPKKRAERFSRHSNFIDAYIFKQIVVAAEAQDPSVISQWSELYEGALHKVSTKKQSNKSGGDSSSRRKRRHKGRSRRKRS
ncbi:MAG: polynucleotide adenylyltransferase PcnB [Kiritimatiellia bacterium]